MDRDHDEYALFIAPIEDQMIQSVWRIVGDPDDAKDALQEALVRIWKGWGRVRRHPNPHAYILRTCINCAYDQLRRSKRTRHGRLDQVVDVAFDPGASPMELLVAAEGDAAVMTAIGTLPRMQRLAIHMHCIDGQPYSEIAEAFRCTEATVRKHVFRAKTRLRSLLSSSVTATNQGGALR